LQVFGVRGDVQDPDHSFGKYEVTQAQWEAVMGNNPAYFKQCGESCPVESVSWNDVQEFIKKLNQQTGKTYRLPTEAEWEYAARSGGKSEKYSGGNNVDSVAWYNGNSGKQTHPVGRKQPNGLGIYDMSGNVWEWVEDIYSNSAYRAHNRNNPIYWKWFQAGESRRQLERRSEERSGGQSQQQHPG
jgi:formylglycine-generating enzyme